MCGACKVTPYCGQKCQELAYTGHAKACVEQENQLAIAALLKTLPPFSPPAHKKIGTPRCPWFACSHNLT